MKAEWDILHDESSIQITPLSAGHSDLPSNHHNNNHSGDSEDECDEDEDEDENDTQGSPPGEGSVQARCAKLCGLWKLKVRTLEGRLTIDERGLKKAFSSNGAAGAKENSLLL